MIAITTAISPISARRGSGPFASSGMISVGWDGFLPLGPLVQ
jgi:hypothetical protein